ncbi:arf-GAP with coiled-coil, ANK repeat and PH domain-containing protein 3-like [Scyliorhinus canicula]|uniref:arf-GAP with coiled-coil, ANK repeat and PH domain-containing protein 3-like n=1 Tax=Scyliorhinus canicula TaxID=7830 RepID=UPI0018F5DD23|nr:arf-GAP with coiled-coil, ANK repeat and PH domain-containing protein 3-like [Scyliorhinus canicula]
MVLELEECVKDSPRFRVTLHQMENDVQALEGKLENVVNLCEAMIDSGHAYNRANRRLVEAIQGLSQSLKDKGLSNILEQCVEGLQEMIEYHTMLLDQTDRAIKTQLQNIITHMLYHRDIWRLREMKKDFERISEDLESAVFKNGQVSRHRIQEAEECSHILVATLKCFRHLALDYILQLNSFAIDGKFKIINTMLSYLNAENTFFHQGYDLITDLDPLMKNMSVQLDQIATNLIVQQKDMERKQMTTQQQQENVANIGTEFLSKAPPGIAIEGYLFKRASRSSKTWNRSWFTIQNNQLVTRSIGRYTVFDTVGKDDCVGESSGSQLHDTMGGSVAQGGRRKNVRATVVGDSTVSQEQMVPLMEDLRLCSVRPLDGLERRFCFEVFSVRTSCVLQADSESLREAWIRAIESSIHSAYRVSQDPDNGSQSSNVSAPSVGRECPREGPSVLQQVLRLPGNERCCDCGRADPRWASINLGITLCIECSGIHRGLGVHHSKVRSLTLDSWEPELLKLFCALGNSANNRIYEVGRDVTGVNKVTAESSRQQKEQWIKAKYVEKRFLNELPFPARCTEETGTLTDQSEGSLTMSQDLCLFRAASVGDLPEMCAALARGANVNWTNIEDTSRTPLIAAAEVGSLTACEFLLQNGANVNYRDARGQGAIHIATRAGHTGPVCLLLKRGANQYAVDETGQDPLSIAVAKANADIVTLLRLARMNEEMREGEPFFGHTGDDETFQDIFRDFSRMASDDPEKLARRQFECSGAEK